MKKTFILDTNVLVTDPMSIFAFGNNIVLIPMIVLDELDKLKKGVTITAFNARKVARILWEKLRDNGQEVNLANGGMIRIYDHKDYDLPTDNVLLNIATKLSQNDSKIFLVTNDVYLLIKAKSKGINAQEYLNNRVSDDNIFLETKSIYLTQDEINLFYSNQLELNSDFYPNQFINVFDKFTHQQVGIGRYFNGILLPVNNNDCFGLKTRNREQTMALNVLLDPSVSLIFLTGSAGTGKTLLALAAGLKQVINKTYDKILVTRPIIPLGNDIGFLPGEKDEKLKPWMAPIFDNLDFIFLNRNKKSKKEISLNELKDKIELEAVTYIRGRSIPKQFIIIDEAQNLTPHEAKTILTRVGEGSKIVFTGDVFQIDHPYLDTHNNGLAYLIEKFKPISLSAHVNFLKGERSELSEIAARILN